ncbi:hypothetical protein AVEN_92204-1 [Araneus ventricosus]|uniref:Uncharacterized protein n=1 Tax=Araneus ventricosus TaxID=182803 RepID=A0A4Y2AK90_ARAVE|nr:hypothetical protein AVEN_92204-1 [Araneus ventricosus]
MSIGLFVLFVICVLETLEHPTLRDWVRAYLPLNYFKSQNEEHVHQVSSTLASMSIGVFVICVLETLQHATQRDLVRAYSPLQYFKSANEEPEFQVSSKLD